MSQQDVPVDKQCPSCKKPDHTSFSKCRFCGTRYDAKISAEPNNVTPAIAWAVGIACVLSFAFISMSSRKAENETEHALDRKSITSEIILAKRPRVVEFYADWCGPCKAYGPIVEACTKQYAGRVDFQRVNIDVNHDLPKAFDVTAVPTTCLLDKQGQLIDQFTGGVSAEELNKRVAQLASK